MRRGVYEHREGEFGILIVEYETNIITNIKKYKQILRNYEQVSLSGG